MRVGIFDSGRGGEFIADGLRGLLPQHEYIVVNDRAHVPYGSRLNAEVLQLTDAAIQPLLAKCPVIVIACNTATMAAIQTLRERYPTTKFVGIEPMIKPASLLSKTKHCTMLATPLTLKSERYRSLVALYGDGLRIDEPSASGWAAAIEFDQTKSIDYSEVATSIASGSDTIILACTHYIALKKLLSELFPTVTLLEPTEAIAKQITRLVA